MTTDNFQDGRYYGDTKEEVMESLIADAEQAFDHEFSEDEAIIIRSFYDPIAERIVELHNGITDVINASQVDFSEDQALDYLGARLGVIRTTARRATGRVRFNRDSPTSTDRFIPQGTIVETNEIDPIEFETDEASAVAVLDDFEDADISNYNGDTTDFSASTTRASDGTYSLKADAVSGSGIYTKETTFGPGSKVHVDIYPNTDTIPVYWFGVDDQDNHYKVTLDTASGSVSLDVVDGGTSSNIDSTSATLPNSEWLTLIVDWKIDGRIIVTVENAGGTEIASFEASESTPTFTEDLGFGFASADATSTKYFDFNTMSAVGVDVTAIEGGTGGSLGAEVLTVMPDPPTGIESVTNPEPTAGGRDREEDDDYRARIKSELGEGVRGTQRGLIEQLEALDGVKSVTVIENDSSSTDADGRPDHSAEPVVQTSQSWYEEVAQTIIETKGTGYPTVGGYAGTSHTATAELPNGQTKDITFSTPAETQIYVDVDVETTDEYQGDDNLADEIVRYIGGTITNGDSEDGELENGDDVIYSSLMATVAGAAGVHDVTNLEVGTSSSPTGTSNVSIANTEIAEADATDGSLDITSTDI